MDFGDYCSAGELLRLIALKKIEIKREKSLEYFNIYGVKPDFDLGFEIAQNGMWGELHGYYTRLEKLFTGKVRNIDRRRKDIHTLKSEW